MRLLRLIPLVLLVSLSACAQAVYNQISAQGDWDGPHPPNPLTEMPCQGGTQQVPPTPGQLGFTFTFSQAYRQTAAAVFNAAGANIRTLWSRRSYQAGSYCGLWDGMDDYGNVVPTSAGPFTVKVRANNITHTWQMIGTTESSWSSADSIDGVMRNVPWAVTFMGGKGYAADGFAENGDDIGMFPEATPNSWLHFNRALNGKSGTAACMDIANDGTNVYCLFNNGYTLVMLFSQSGQPLSFPSGTNLGSLGSGVYGGVLSNVAMQQAPYQPTQVVLDYTTTGTGSITGLAVQQGAGGYIATLHGQYEGIASQNAVFLWSKTTGAQVGSSISITNPQKAVFDNNGNLWVIGGNSQNDQLYEVTSVGTSNTVSQPISGLLNPTSITVDRTTGDLIVLDGGTHQQALEFNTSSYAQVTSGTLGSLGGYCPTSGCSANIDPAGYNTPTLWVDPNILSTSSSMYPNISAIGTFSPFVAWVQADENGGLWLFDWSASRILHYTRSSPSSSWVYQNRVVYLGNSDKQFGSIVRSAPTRIFGGLAGWLEFAVNYSVPVQPGDPEAAGGNGSWDIVRNWMPAVYAAAGTATEGYAPQVTDAQTLPNGNTLAITTNGMYLVPTSGVLTYTSTQPPNSSVLLGNSGEINGFNVSSGTIKSSAAPITSYTAQGFPNWGTFGAATAGVTPNTSIGDPTPYASYSLGPSVNGIWAFEGVANTSQSGQTAWWGGTFNASSTTLQSHFAPQKSYQFWSGDGAVPNNTAALSGQHEGFVNMVAMPGTSDVFALWNGNNAPWSCGLFHYSDDGMLMGQYGWQGGHGWQYNGASWGIQGYAPTGVGLPPVPGHCADPYYLKVAPVLDGYVETVGDESYRKALHLWLVQGLSTALSKSGNGVLGNVINLQ